MNRTIAALLGFLAGLVLTLGSLIAIYFITTWALAGLHRLFPHFLTP